MLSVTFICKLICPFWQMRSTQTVSVYRIKNIQKEQLHN